jgi:hypothetical protein
MKRFLVVKANLFRNYHNTMVTTGLSIVGSFDTVKQAYASIPEEIEYGDPVIVIDTTTGERV